MSLRAESKHESSTDSAFDSAQADRTWTFWTTTTERHLFLQADSRIIIRRRSGIHRREETSVSKVIRCTHRAVETTRRVVSTEGGIARMRFI